MQDSIGQRLKELITALDMKKVRFAEKIKVDQSYITHLINGKGNPSDRIIDDICREFNVSEYWLRNGEGPMFRPPKTIDNELAIELANLINSEDEFIKQCVLNFLRLSDESKELFKEFLISIVEDIKKVEK